MRIEKSLALAVALALASPALADDRSPGSTDSGFATKSVTGLGLTGDTGKTSSTPAPGSGVVSPPAAGTGGSAGPAIGTGPGTPAPGGGTFGAPSRR